MAKPYLPAAREMKEGEAKYTARTRKSVKERYAKTDAPDALLQKKMEKVRAQERALRKKGYEVIK